MISAAFFGGKDDAVEKKKNQLSYYLKLAAESFNKGNIIDAENYFTVALHRVDDLLEKKQIDETEQRLLKTHIYDAMASMSYSDGELEKSEGFYKECLKHLLALGYEKDYNHFLEISLKLSNVFTALDKDEEAVAGFQFVIKAVENKIKTRTEEFLLDEQNSYGLLSLALENYAKYMVGKRDFAQAEILLKKADETVMKYKGEEDPQRVTLLADISSVQILSKNYTGAEATLLTAIKLAQSTDDANLPAVYSSLGAFYMRIKNFEKACEVCEKLQKIGEDRQDANIMTAALKCIEQATLVKDTKGGESVKTWRFQETVVVGSLKWDVFNFIREILLFSFDFSFLSSTAELQVWYYNDVIIKKFIS